MNLTAVDTTSWQHAGKYTCSWFPPDCGSCVSLRGAGVTVNHRLAAKAAGPQLQYIGSSRWFNVGDILTLEGKTYRVIKVRRR